jgi:hypothetical protein
MCINMGNCITVFVLKREFVAHGSSVTMVLNEFS